MTRKPQYRVTDISDFVPRYLMWWELPSALRSHISLAGELTVAAIGVPAGRTVPTSVRCRRRPNHKVCTGSLQVYRQDVPPRIEWSCPECGDGGLLTNWTSSPWYRSVDPGGNMLRIEMPADATVGVIRSEHIYSNTIPVLQRGSMENGMISIEASLDDLECLLGCAVSEALTDSNPHPPVAQGLASRLFYALRGIRAADGRTIVPEYILHQYGTMKPESNRSEWCDLRVQLLHIDPPIWRRIRVPIDLTLHELHAVLQLAMGWMEVHEYAMEAGSTRFCFQDGQAKLGAEIRDTTRTPIRAVLDEAGDALIYAYDPGDFWRHRVTLMERMVPDDSVRLSCLEGARACPPEAVGGPSGYRDLLATLSNASDPRHREAREWLGGQFYPDAFDLDRADGLLARLDRHWWPNGECPTGPQSGRR